MKQIKAIVIGSRCLWVFGVIGVLVLAGCGGGGGSDAGGDNPVCVDADGDGIYAQSSCSPSGDCDDDAKNTYPGAPEACDGVDNDCDGSVDEGVTSTFYQDGDGDTYGNPTVSTQACVAPAGYVSDSTDCNDGSNAVNPGAAETCDGVDNDCDGSVDEGLTSTFYQDGDGDTYGNPTVSTQSCSAPAGYVSDNTDCNDAGSGINPGATETCDGVDNDCDGSTDEGLTNACGTCGPAPLEVCDGIDNDCDGSTDEGLTNACGTCGPVPLEVCDGVDNDCDGSTDEDLTYTFYQDGDGDGYGNPESALAVACAGAEGYIAPDGYVADNTDCDDTSAAVKPGAVEICNTVDDDCDGQIDENLTTTFYADTDGDTYGNPDASTQACSVPADHVTDNTDCDDASAGVNPGAVETCNDVDDNCDGQVDEGDVCDECPGDPNKLEPGICGCGTPDIDADGDGYYACQFDCDDGDPAINPGAVEVPDNRIDENCDGIDAIVTGAGIPVEPSLVATSLDPTLVTPLSGATEFLYTGDDPIQAGVDPGTMAAERVAVVRGKVSERSGAALSGVSITILDHREYGLTLSREGGLFDLAVNGGTKLVVNFRKEGYLPVQRRIDVPWQDYVWMPEVVMIPVDSQVTTIDLTSAEPIQVAVGSVVTDDDGTRQAMVMFPQGTTAQATRPDGSKFFLDSLDVRFSEYTVGDSGPDAMPGELPPTTGYTYAVELSVDEVLASGIKVNGKDLVFNQPVSFYLDNFLNFPTGTIVPVGYYDNDQAAWIPSNDGMVIEIVGETGGMADLDVDGSGNPADGPALASLNISDAERQQLALRYSPGDSLWRVQTRHFSTMDCNWALAAPPPDATPPPKPNPPGTPPGASPGLPPGIPPGAGLPGGKKDCNQSGSIIGCLDQTLGESVPITGTPFSLHYQSERMPGSSASRLVIPISGETVPDLLQEIELEIYVAGHKFTETITPAPNLTYMFTWDGIDAYERPTQGAMPVQVNLGYAYAVFYRSPDEFGQSFAMPTTTSYVTSNEARKTVTIWESWTGYIGNSTAVNQSVGGWTLSNHHFYDTAAGNIYLGSGAVLDTDFLPTVETVAGPGTLFDGIYQPQSLVSGQDGSLYISQYYDYTVKRIWPDGTITTWAGGGTYDGCSQLDSCDGVPATNVRFQARVEALAMGPDDNLYLVVGKRIFRVGPDGIIYKVAGNGETANSGDGGPAVEAGIGNIYTLAVTSDNTLYFPGYLSIRRVGPGGIISTVSLPDELVAKALVVGPDDSLYIATSDQIYRLGSDGTYTHLAGDASYCTTTDICGDGGPAVEAAIAWQSVKDMIIDDDGGILLTSGQRIRYISPDGIIRTVAGQITESGFGGDGGSPAGALFAGINGMSMGPDGRLCLADRGSHRIRCVTGRLRPGADFIPSLDGSELYVFEAGTGRHLQTLHALTGAVLYDFAYDDNGLLVSVVDGYGNTTTIERDVDGNPLAIVAPGGQRTSLGLDANHYLVSIVNPANEVTNMTYHEGGLLASLTRPAGGTSLFTFNELGRLVRDDNPEGGYKVLAKTDTDSGYSVSVTTALGRETTYSLEASPTGQMVSRFTQPDGAATETISNADGSTTTTYANGTAVTMRHVPDPRFGMWSPYVQELTIETPGGGISTLTQTREVELSDPFDPMSLVRYTNTVTQNGQAFVTAYEAATRTFTFTSPEGRQKGRQTVTELDAMGRAVRTVVDPSVDAATSTYDTYGRLIEQSHGLQAWTYAYDDKNRVVSRTDASGKAVQFTYDDADRVVEALYPDGEKEIYAYDGNGKMTSLTMPNGAVHQLTYDLNRLLTGYIPPGSTTGDERFYDLDGAMESRTFPSGKTIANSFDDGGRWINELYDEARVDFGYTESCCGQLTSLDWTSTSEGGPSQQIGFSYDGVLPTQTDWSGTASGTFGYAYGEDLLIDEISLQSGLDTVATAYTRDLDEKVVGLGAFELTREGPAGAVSQISDGNLTMTITYDSLARVASRQYTVNDQPIYSLSLVRNHVGKIVQKIETQGGTSHTIAYTYDERGRLSAVLVDGTPMESYAYDVNNNMTGSPSGSGTYDTRDRLTGYGGTTYSFDDDGFLSSRGSDLFSYSVRGELLQAVLGGTVAITYQYDGLKRRVGRNGPSGQYQYLYGNPGSIFQVTAARDEDGVLTVYHYGEDGMLFAMERSGAVYYIATDQIGTPRVVANASGVVVKILAYDSFGNPVYDSDPGFDLPFGFAGGLEDRATGLVRFGHRDYDPVSSRWMASDPVLYDGGQANLYSYVGNDPVTYRDPLGLWCVSASVYLGFGVGGETCCSGGSCSICNEGGFGYGTSVGVGSGEAKQDGDRIKVTGGVECGPASLGFECSTGARCGPKCDDPNLGLGLGPLGVDNSNNITVDPTGDFDVDLKCSAQVKAAYEGCGSFANPLNGLWN